MSELYIAEPNSLELRESAPLHAVEANELKIRVIYGGICGSDLSVYRGKIQHATYPVRPGHELVGIVEQAGSHVSISEGTRVVVTPNTFCGQCEYCLNEQENICPHKKSIGINASGGFAHEFIIDSRYVIPIPDDVSNERAVLIEPLAVIVHGLKKLNIKKGDRVLVVGCGTEGLLTVALADYLGADVTAVDINHEKLDMLKPFPHIRATHPDAIEEDAFDYVVEAAGTPQSVQSCFRWLKPGGSVLLIGITNESELPIGQIVRKEQTIYGSIIYRFPKDFAESIEYLSDERFDPTVFISKILPLADFEKAYELALSGSFAKILIDFQNKEEQS
ncbi:zinc-binding dehydrogenase [Geomicrobium sp. JSM 1781026]|uniref:zinc-dependent alcohol dehydrogenase n=1 Tax=Geomicrobium sp. JSM 1781026 TaxID=3344580 RepID=UPI0035C224E0